MLLLQFVTQVNMDVIVPRPVEQTDMASTATTLVTAQRTKSVTLAADVWWSISPQKQQVKI
jgi:hypothetical protein